MLKGGLSQRGPEVFRDALYAMFPALERHKNRGRTLELLKVDQLKCSAIKPLIPLAFR